MRRLSKMKVSHKKCVNEFCLEVTGTSFPKLNPSYAHAHSYGVLHTVRYRIIQNSITWSVHGCSRCRNFTGTADGYQLPCIPINAIKGRINSMEQKGHKSACTCIVMFSEGFVYFNMISNKTTQAIVL